MQLNELRTEVSGENVECVPVIRWAMATLLGDARRQTNEDGRHQRRNRGSAKNVLNDLYGAVAELSLYAKIAWPSSKLVHEHERQYLSNQLYNPCGGRLTHGPDLELLHLLPEEGGFAAAEIGIGIDVKSFDCAPNKRYFAINVAKHKQLQGVCDFYFGMIVPPLGKTAVISQVVPYQEVSKWKEFDLGKRGDPSFNLRIEEFIKRHAPAAKLEDLASDRYTFAELASSAQEEKTQKALISAVTGVQDQLDTDNIEQAVSYLRQALLKLANDKDLIRPELLCLESPTDST